LTFESALNDLLRFLLPSHHSNGNDKYTQRNTDENGRRNLLAHSTTSAGVKEYSYYARFLPIVKRLE